MMNEKKINLAHTIISIVVGALSIVSLITGLMNNEKLSQLEQEFNIYSESTTSNISEVNNSISEIGTNIGSIVHNEVISSFNEGSVNEEIISKLKTLDIYLDDEKVKVHSDSIPNFATRTEMELNDNFIVDAVNRERAGMKYGDLEIKPDIIMNGDGYYENAVKLDVSAFEYLIADLNIVGHTDDLLTITVYDDDSREVFFSRKDTKDDFGNVQFDLKNVSTLTFHIKFKDGKGNGLVGTYFELQDASLYKYVN